MLGKHDLVKSSLQYLGKSKYLMKRLIFLVITLYYN